MANLVLKGEKGKNEHYHYVVDPHSRPLGSGGMGQVLRGQKVNEDTGTSTEVAIKFLYDDLPLNVIDRARKEASIQINNDNLVEMREFLVITEEINGTPVKRYHVVSELLRGVRLLDLLKGENTDFEGNEVAFATELSQRYHDDRESTAVFIIKNILSGIMALHDYGYIHRDIDPSNIMVTSEKKIKIIDYGLVKKIDSVKESQDAQLTYAGQFVGKVAYAAPELVAGDIEHQNVTTDFYAIGILLYRLIVGSLPFDGTKAEVMRMQLQESLPLEKVSNPQIREIIRKATEKKQEDRYQSASEFRVALEHLKLNEDNNLSNEDAEDYESEDSGNSDGYYEPSKPSKSNDTLKNVAIWGGAILAGGLLGALLRLVI